MNNDLISRSALLEHITTTCDQFIATASGSQLRSGAIRAKAATLRLVSECPAVDAEVVRHGRWIRRSHRIFGNTYDYECSVCGCDYALAEYSYCPNCGAKMDAEVEG